jgi:hypothetical protein
VNLAADFASTLYAVLYYLVYFLPGYLGLVLVPAIIRSLVERALGIAPELYGRAVGSSHHAHSCGNGGNGRRGGGRARGRYRRYAHQIEEEGLFARIAIDVLYYPFFEEVFFRGVPLLIMGLPGLVVGSAVWIVLHPVWQVKLVEHLPPRKKALFLLTCSSYYASCAAFYSMVWLASPPLTGVVAFVYHSLHNALVTLSAYLRELPPPWKKSEFVRPRTVAGGGLRIRRGEGRREEREEAGEGEEIEFETFMFVRPRRSLKSLREEELGELLFVKRRRD